MSSYNFTRPTKPNYFVNLLVKGYIFPAVLIATVLATILSVGFQIDLFSQLENNSKIFFIAFLVFFITILTVYVCFSIKNTEVGMNDSVSVGYFFAGIIYFVYLIAYGRGFKYIDSTNIVISLSLVIFGIILTLLSSLFFKCENKNEGCTRNCYLIATSKKFSFISIILSAIVINFLFFILLDIKHEFVDSLIEKGFYDAPDYFFTYIKDLILENKVLIGFVIVGALLLLLYAIFSLNEKKINALDLFLWGYIFNLPILIALVCLIGNNDNMTNYLIVVGISIVVIVFAIIRSIFYKKPNTKPENSIFFKKFFDLKNIFLSFGLMALLVLFINVANETEIISLFVENKELNVYIGLVPFVLTFIACLIGFVYVGFGLIKSVIIFNKPLYDKNDNLILFNVAFGLFELIALLFVEQSLNLVNIVILASYVIISFDVALLRRSEIK